MLSVSLSALRDDVRERYDLPAFSATTHVTTTRVNKMINDSVKALYALLMEARPDEYCTYEDTITVAASTVSTDLSTALTSATFVDLRAVIWLEGTYDPVELEAGTVENYACRSESPDSWDESTRYWLVRDQLYWLPPPSGSRSVRIAYVGMPADLSADGDTIQVQPGWDQYVVLDVCAKIADKEEQDPGVWVAQRDRVERAIMSQRERTKGAAKGRGRQARDRRGIRSGRAWGRWGL